MLEKDIQDQIIEWLQYQRGTFIWRQNAGMRVGEYKGKKHVFRAVSVDGISDVMGIWRGMPLAIEVKRWPNKPSQVQEDFLNQFAKAGGVAMVAYCLDHVVETLRKYEALQVFDAKIVHWNRRKPLK